MLHHHVAPKDSEYLLHRITQVSSAYERVHVLNIIVGLSYDRNGNPVLTYRPGPSASQPPGFPSLEKDNQLNKYTGNINAKDWKQLYRVRFSIDPASKMTFPVMPNAPIYINPDRNWDHDESNPENPLEKSCSAGNDEYSLNRWQIRVSEKDSNSTAVEIIDGNYTLRNENEYDLTVYRFHHYRLLVILPGKTMPECIGNDPVLKNGDGQSPGLLLKLLRRQPKRATASQPPR